MHLLLLDIFDNIRTLGWSGAIDLLRNGLTLGSLYALIALGYSMVYGILKLLNFAHGDVYMIGAFLGYFALHGLGGPPLAQVASGEPEPAGDGVGRGGPQHRR